MSGERVRGFAVVLIALLASAYLFRPQISTAIMLRGDDFLARGDAGKAMQRYKRALWMDAGNGAALDRVLFAQLQQRRTNACAGVLARANAYLAGHPADAAILEDRALCETMMRRSSAAANDFERAARAGGGAQAFVFAGWAAAKTGSPARAKRLWLSAIAIDPRDSAARSALEAVR